MQEQLWQNDYYTECTGHMLQIWSLNLQNQCKKKIILNQAVHGQKRIKMKNADK